MDSFQDLANMTLDFESKPERRTTTVTTQPQPLQPQTFKDFIRLPPELRIMIWELAIESIEPRILGDRPTDGQFRFRNFDHLGTSPIPRGLLPAENTLWIPSILLVNEESEEIGLKYYHNISMRPKHNPIYYNPAKDSVSILGPLHVTSPIVSQISRSEVQRVHITSRVVYMTASPGYSYNFIYRPTFQVDWNWAKVVNQNILEYITIGDWGCHVHHLLPFGMDMNRFRPWELIIEDLPCRNHHEIEDQSTQIRWAQIIRAELMQRSFGGIMLPSIVFKVAEKSTAICADCRALKTKETKMKNPRKRHSRRPW
ncbi:hypothetical protein NHQ30_002159 [Ciborinia camelliae]|nr:hypothetical protein NHQ30_002159 [Ciborinia camelliae]